MDLDAVGLAAEGTAPLGVLSLLAMPDTDETLPPSAHADDLVATMALLRALAGRTGRCWAARLWLATRGAVGTGPADRPRSPGQALTWGFGPSVAAEHPELWGGLIDLPEVLDDHAAARLATVLGDQDGENQVAIEARRRAGPGGWSGPSAPARLRPARGRPPGPSW